MENLKDNLYQEETEILFGIFFNLAQGALLSDCTRSHRKPWARFLFERKLNERTLSDNRKHGNCVDNGCYNFTWNCLFEMVDFLCI